MSEGTRGDAKGRPKTRSVPGVPQCVSGRQWPTPERKV